MDIVEEYRENEFSLRKTAQCLGISAQKCRKLLIEKGAYTSELSVRVADAYRAGLSVKDIAAKFKMSTKNVSAYLPYQKGEYTGISRVTTR